MLMEERNLLKSLLNGILEEFQKRQKNPSSDCCASLNLTMDLVKIMLRIPKTDEERGEVSLRMRTLDKKTACQILEWTSGDEDHPLMKLTALLEVRRYSDESSPN